MKIVKTTAWKDGKFIGLFFKQLLSKDPLDPWPILKDAHLFIAYDENKPVSYCTIKNWKTCLELGTVVTEKKFRGKKYSSKLISGVLKDYGPIYVTCKTGLEGFYNQFGFKKIAEGPSPIKQRIKFANFFTIGREYITMKR